MAKFKALLQCWHEKTITEDTYKQFKAGHTRQIMFCSKCKKNSSIQEVK